MMKILINYNYTPDWLEDEDYLLYDRSDSDEWLKDFPKEKVIKTKNIGQVDYDKLGFIVDHYFDLPEVFLLAKSNIFKSITPEEFEKVKNNESYTPLLTQNHKTYSDKRGVVCYYQDGMYYERNDSWYVSQLPWKHFETFNAFAKAFFLPSPPYLPFAPGGNYIITRDRVQRYGQATYGEMRRLLPYAQNPAEAHMIERSYHLLWK